jgi:hypothetical protein
MGETYRASDSNLKRSVAIKVLPAAADFTQRAKADGRVGDAGWRRAAGDAPRQARQRLGVAQRTD